MGRAVTAVPPGSAPPPPKNLGGSRGGVRRVSGTVGTCGRAGGGSAPSAGISANSASNIPRQRGHHTRCRSPDVQPIHAGSTLGSPSQPSDFAPHAPVRHCPRAVSRRWAGFRAGLGAPGRGVSATQHLRLSGFHSFIHSGKNPTGVNTGIRQPGPQLWITAPVNAFSSTGLAGTGRNGLSH